MKQMIKAVAADIYFKNKTKATYLNATISLNSTTLIVDGERINSHNPLRTFGMDGKYHAKKLKGKKSIDTYYISNLTGLYQYYELTDAYPEEIKLWPLYTLEELKEKELKDCFYFPPLEKKIKAKKIIHPFDLKIDGETYHYDEGFLTFIGDDNTPYIFPGKIFRELFEERKE